MITGWGFFRIMAHLEPRFSFQSHHYFLDVSPLYDVVATYIFVVWLKNIHGYTMNSWYLWHQLSFIHYTPKFKTFEKMWEINVNTAVEIIKCSAVVFTCQHCEVRRAGNGEEGWGNIGCLHPILGHLIQVGGFNILVIVPAEAVKRDEQ